MCHVGKVKKRVELGGLFTPHLLLGHETRPPVVLLQYLAETAVADHYPVV